MYIYKAYCNLEIEYGTPELNKYYINNLVPRINVCSLDKANFPYGFNNVSINAINVKLIKEEIINDKITLTDKEGQIYKVTLMYNKQIIGNKENLFEEGWVAIEYIIAQLKQHRDQPPFKDLIDDLFFYTTNVIKKVELLNKK